MRIFPFLLILLSFNLHAQVDSGTGIDDDCDATEVTGGAVEYNCDTLNIAAGTHVFPSIPGQIVRIKVTGNVNIASGAVLVLRGDNGVSDAAGGALPTLGGPGGGDGGGNQTGPEDSPELPNGGSQGVSNPGGASVCGGGGGGGGFSTNGDAGSSCAFAGGVAGLQYNLAILFRGGFGGGAGGTAEGNNPPESGTGGGGGGAIWISAGGNITINGNIDVRGGSGGAGAVNSGGGGGGSGGAIRIQSLASIINNGTFLIAGGNGGAGNGAGARGGNGSAGIFEFEDADNIVYGNGTGAIPLPGESFNSSISCGAVKMKDDQNLLFQMMIGFALIVLISRIRGRFRHSV
jgi:hypothetical protein